MIRFFDIFFSLCGLFILLPLFVIVYFAIRLESRGSAIFRQDRVGKDGRLFSILKFRSMREERKEDRPLITVTGDPRITKVGRVIRKTKVDELPQLWNVLRGDMSLVGPRPEVPKYVALYTTEQREVLSVQPGVTDLASLTYVNEETILSQADDPENYYQKVVLPEKIRLNLIYIRKRTLRNYFSTLLGTVQKVVCHKSTDACVSKIL